MVSLCKMITTTGDQILSLPVLQLNPRALLLLSHIHQATWPSSAPFLATLLGNRSRTKSQSKEEKKEELCHLIHHIWTSASAVPKKHRKTLPIPTALLGHKLQSTSEGLGEVRARYFSHYSQSKTEKGLCHNSKSNFDLLVCLFVRLKKIQQLIKKVE